MGGTRQNSIQHIVISMDPLDMNVILDMRMILLMENVESYPHQCQWKKNIQRNTPKIQNVKVIEIIRGVIFYSAVKEVSHILLFIPDFNKVEFAFIPLFIGFMNLYFSIGDLFHLSRNIWT